MRPTSTTLRGPLACRACFEAALEGLHLPKPDRDGSLLEGYLQLGWPSATLSHLDAAIAYARLGDVTGCRGSLVLVEAVLRGPVERSAEVDVRAVEERAAKVRDQAVDYKLSKAEKLAAEVEGLDALVLAVRPALSAIATWAGPRRGVRITSGTNPIYLGIDCLFFSRDANDKAHGLTMEEVLSLTSLVSIARRLDELLNRELEGNRVRRTREVRHETEVLRAVTVLLKGIR